MMKRSKISLLTWSSVAAVTLLAPIVSADSIDTHVRFAQSLGMPFKLLSDPDQKVARKFGADGPNGYNRRVVYVINAKGRVSYRDLKFGALDPKAYKYLKDGIKDAKRGR